MTTPRSPALVPAILLSLAFGGIAAPAPAADREPLGRPGKPYLVESGRRVEPAKRDASESEQPDDDRRTGPIETIGPPSVVVLPETTPKTKSNDR